MAVVGTLLALLVFFALFGIFLTQYVPLWMTDNESQFTSQASASFAEFKSSVDSQYLLNGPPAYGTSFTISSQGVPLIAQPTEGDLAFIPSTCPNGFYYKGSSGGTLGQPMNPNYCVFQNVTLSVGPGGSGYYSQHAANEVLEMQLPNRYYNAQNFYLEDDAVVQSQGGAQQILTLPPPFNVTTVPGNTSFVGSFLQLVGDSASAIGQGSEQVYSHLRFSDPISSNGRSGAPFNLTYQIGTQYPCAWARFFQSMMNVSGITATSTAQYSITYSAGWTTPAIDVVSTPSALAYLPLSACSNPNGQTTVISVALTSINYASIYYAGAQVTLGIGGT